MAKVKGPLLSMRASGTIAKTEVFATWRGIPYVRMHVIPQNPNTVEQQLTRGVFSWLNDLYRHLAANSLQPWDLHTIGRPFTPRNAFIKSNLPVLRGDADLTDFTASPGARGGPAPDAFSAVAGALAGEIDVTWTPGVLPAGWTVAKAVALAVYDQDPGGALLANLQSVEVANPGPYLETIGGLVAAHAYSVNGWFVYQRPEGTTAIGPSINLMANAHA